MFWGHSRNDNHPQRYENKCSPHTGPICLYGHLSICLLLCLSIVLSTGLAQVTSRCLCVAFYICPSLSAFFLDSPSLFHSACLLVWIFLPLCVSFFDPWPMRGEQAISLENIRRAKNGPCRIKVDGPYAAIQRTRATPVWCLTATRATYGPYRPPLDGPLRRAKNGPSQMRRPGGEGVSVCAAPGTGSVGGARVSVWREWS